MGVVVPRAPLLKFSEITTEKSISALRKAHKVLSMGRRPNKKVRENSCDVEFYAKQMLTTVDFTGIKSLFWKA